MAEDIRDTMERLFGITATPELVTIDRKMQSQMNKQIETYGVLGFFDGVSETISLSQGVYSQVTNGAGNLWQNVELTGFTANLDKITCLNTAKYAGHYMVAFTGTNLQQYSFRLWNETKGVAIGPTVPATGTGPTSTVDVTIPFSGIIEENDVIYLQVANLDGSNDITMKAAYFDMDYKIN